MSNSLSAGSFIATRSDRSLLIRDFDHRGAQGSQPPGLGVDPLPAGCDRNGSSAAGADIQVQPVLDRLRLGYHLEPDARPSAARVDDAVYADPQVFLRQSDVAPVVIPGAVAGRRRLNLISQRRGPQARKPLGIGAVNR